MIWAVLAAPLVVFPLAAAPFIGIPQLGLFLGAVAVAIAYFFTFFYGIPVFFLLRRMGLIGFWPLTLAGMAGGALAFILTPLFGMYAGPGGLVGLPICGGIVGATAWWIAYRLPQRRGSDL